MNYADWQNSVPDSIRADSLWRMTAYRLALFLGDVAWSDVTKLSKDRRTAGVSDQLYRAVGSISANLAEGYSRGTGRDRARFYEYALGSAREARDWYFKGRHLLGESVSEHRFRFLAEIIRLLLTMVPDQRGFILKETEVPYRVDPLAPAALDALLSAVQLPETYHEP
jgi:four helix bundle protein